MGSDWCCCWLGGLCISRRRGAAAAGSSCRDAKGGARGQRIEGGTEVAPQRLPGPPQLLLMGPVPAPRPSVLDDDNDDAMQVLHHARAHQAPSTPGGALLGRFQTCVILLRRGQGSNTIRERGVRGPNERAPPLCVRDSRGDYGGAAPSHANLSPSAILRSPCRCM